MIGDMIADVVAEVVGYATGRVVLAVVTPHINIAPLSTSVSPPRPRWFSLTYLKDGRRYYFDETVTAAGILFWLVIAAVIGIAWSR